MSRARPLMDVVPVYKYGITTEPLNYESHTIDEMEKHAAGLSKSSLKAVAQKRSTSNPTIEVHTTQEFRRDPYIKEYAKRWANGVCQLCETYAPFNKPDGEPFLETHHIKPLAEGGSDSIENVVALCPNCHRKMHYVSLEADENKLLLLAKNASDL